MTFLFTDVEGSTRRWEADAAAMRTALAAHDQVLRSVIETHDGWLFKHTGDGVCAAFSSPRAAIDAAIAAQRALELPVRMGVATGEAELRDGDYFGAVLNRAARVMAAGHGGQILTAESTAVLLTGVELLDLGPRRLRDLPTPIGLFQVQAAGLKSDFAALKAIDTSVGNLSLSATSFIGREAEVADVQAAVRAHRLVTLTGVGGVGKTRLAVEVAARLAVEFPDGVWFFELAAVTDPAAVADAMAAVLGIVRQPGMTVSQSVAAAMDGRVRLLVLDNCEHLIDAVADVIEAIVAQSAAVKALATSREGLGVSDEQLWPVPSLDAAGIDSAAVALFVDRARSVSPRFSLAHNDDATAVIEICRRLDGIPLAIELAASRIASMTAADVRDRLDHRFRLLVGSRRGLERHQTLRHAVAWSFDLLDDTEKDLLTKCSAFTGGFDLHSARMVAGSDGTDDYAVLDLLDALVRKSLLVIDRSPGQTRYSMLETIRQFAEEQLVIRCAVEEVRAAHAHYFASREAELLALWDSPRQREAYEWLATEMANLRTAFRWAADHADLDTAATVAMLTGYLALWVEQYEPVAWAEEILEPARAVHHRRLLQLYVLAAQCYAAGRVERAFGYLEASQQLAAGGEFDPDLYESQCSTGVVYMAAGQSHRWVELCRNAIARGPGPRTIARACLVMALNFQGKGGEARVASEGLLAAAEATANPNTACMALFACAIAYSYDDSAASYALHRKALTIARESGNRQLETGIAVMLSVAAAAHEDPADSLDYLAQAIRQYHDANSVSLLHNPLAILAGTLNRLGRHEQAATICGFAASAMARGGYPEIDNTMAHLREVLGDQTYESLARVGANMTTAAMVAYAYDQIDQVRTDRNAVS